MCATATDFSRCLRYDFIHAFPNFSMNTLPSLFQSSLLVYVPVGVFLTFALLMTAGLHASGAKPEGVAKAIGCTILKTLGLLLVSLSSVQIGYGLVAMSLPTGQTLLALLILLVVGIGIMIHESRAAAAIDKASGTVIDLIFCHSCRVIGSLLAVVAGLSLSMTFLLTGSVEGAEMPTVLLLLGVLLSLTASVHANGGVKKGKKKR